jgi:hypothetical protein
MSGKCRGEQTTKFVNNVIFQHPAAFVFKYMHVQLPSQVQPYLYVYIDIILQYYMFRLDAIIRYFVSWPTGRPKSEDNKTQTPTPIGNAETDTERWW